MKFVVVVFTALLVAVLATLYALDHPGYVLIARPPWSVEMSLMVFILLSLGGFVTLYLLLYLVVRLIRIPKNVARWRHRRQVRLARTSLYQGIVRLAEGNWVEAEAELLTSMRGTEMPLLSYLAAACVNQAQGNIDKRDEYLAGALRVAPQHRLAVGMTQANLQYLAHQSEQALATLTELNVITPKNKHILKLLAQLYLELRDWTNLAELIPDLRQNKVLTPKETDAIELRVHRELLTLTLPHHSFAVLKQAWDAVPRALQHDAALVSIYARHLIQQNQTNEAEKFLRPAIEQGWSDDLVELYGYALSNTATEQLEIAEGWLIRRPENTRLLLTLGRLAVHAHNDTAARGYFEKCINLRGPIDTYRELGALLERIGETVQALTCYRTGLEAFSDERRLPGIRPGFGLTLRSRAAR